MHYARAPQFGRGLSSRQLAGARFFCHYYENSPRSGLADWNRHPREACPRPRSGSGDPDWERGRPRPHPRSRQRPPSFSSSVLSVATGTANYYENSLQRPPLFAFAMKIDSAAVSGRRGGFQTRPTPVPWDATAFFIPLCGLRKAMVFPAQSPPRTPIRGRNPRPRPLDSGSRPE